MKISSNTPYDSLTPDVVMNALESIGYQPTGAVFTMNSYENRVYDVGIENAGNIVAKFYRPNRWIKEQILEEHQFLQNLNTYEIPVIAPIENNNGETLFEFDGYFFTVFPKFGGRAIELNTAEDYTVMGRLLARIHQVGEGVLFQHRKILTPQFYGWESLSFLRESSLIPAEIMGGYDALVTQLLNQVDAIWRQVDFRNIRVHGDCHLGNILQNHQTYFLDFDDALNAPAVQDLWMFVTGERHEMSQQMSFLLEGYTQLREFKLSLVEALRSLRMIHYSAWIAKRWDDPTFKHNFSFIDTPMYWQQHMQDLREQITILHEPFFVQV